MQYGCIRCLYYTSYSLFAPSVTNIISTNVTILYFTPSRDLDILKIMMFYYFIFITHMLCSVDEYDLF
jgi:hypothetical protein